MTVNWTSNAQQHLAAIRDYIAANSPGYAQNMVDRITRRSVQLESFPLSGGLVTEYEDPSIRELIEYPYRIIYKVYDHRVDVLAVIHGARESPTL